MKLKRLVERKCRCQPADSLAGCCHYTANREEVEQGGESRNKKTAERRWDEWAGGLMKQPNKSHWDVVFPLLLSLTLISLLMCSSSHSAEFLSSSRHLASQSSSFLYVTQFLLVSASALVLPFTVSNRSNLFFSRATLIYSSLLKYRGWLLCKKCKNDAISVCF